MKISNRRIKKMNKQIRLTTICFTAALIFCAVATTVTAQVATGGSYTLNQSVIASGGGQNSTGGGFTVDGTVGQPIAGVRSTNSGFAVEGGFWTASALAPTAAPVSVSGRVLTMDGGGLRNARVTLTDAQGVSRTVLSGKFGAFRFADVAAGETYIINVGSRRYVFQPQILFAVGDLDNLVFTAVGQTGNTVFP